MPEYIPGSHTVDDEAARRISRKEVLLQEGDVLIWKEKTVLCSSGSGAGGRIMLIQFSQGS